MTAWTRTAAGSPPPAICSGSSAATGGANYGQGWIVTSAGTYWPNGDLPGTASIMIRGGNGWSIALLTNSRPNTDTGIARVNSDLDRLGWDIIEDIPDWLRTDLLSWSVTSVSIREQARH